MADAGRDDLERLVQAVLQSARYRQVSHDLIRHIGRQELTSRRNLKEATKGTKNRLHQIYGAYFTGEPRYERWLGELANAAATGDAGTLRAACLSILQRHASTRERVPILDRFYATILAPLPPVHTVLDIGCGLNPLTIPWMGLPPDTTYRCYDVDAGLIAFLNGFFEVTGIRGQAAVCDVASAPPQQPADLGLALKVVPVLDQIERDAGSVLLRALRVAHLLVSFPAHSLSGRDKGMVQHYEARFAALAQAEGWIVRRFMFATELAFLVHKT